MNLSIIFICLFIVIIAFFSVWVSTRRFKGQGWFHSRGSADREETKILKGKVICTKVVYIDGMHSNICKETVEKAVNNIDGALCRVNLKKGFAVVLCDREISEKDMVNTIQKLGYTVIGVESK